MTSLTQEIKDTRLWCDSKVALSWIRSSPHLFQVFVGNRVSEIQKQIPTEFWYCVPSDLNPADYLSRGSSPGELLNNQEKWFCGPKWLHQTSSFWPIDTTFSPSIQIEDLPEVKKNLRAFVHSETPKSELFPFQRFSSFTRITRVMTYCLRFISNCRTSKTKFHESLTWAEIRQAETKLVMLAQEESFEEEFRELSKTGCVKNSSKLLSLTPFLSDNIIRVGGRLRHSSFPVEKRHPALLDKRHHLTYPIFRAKHFEHFHCASQTLLADVRENYWAIAGKNLAKRVVRECIICFNFRSKFIHPLIGNLPQSRISPGTLPFSEVGIDFGGPFFYKSNQGRGSKLYKCYLCLFIYLTVKAVHLELVTDLSTQAFLQAFQRFMSRRGKPNNVLKSWANS